MELRPYQRECIEALPERGAFLIQMATGLGKSLVMSRVPRRGRLLILSHRDELVRQPAKYYSCSFGIEQAKEHSNGEEVVSASVQSLVRRLHRFSPADFDVVAVDECFPAGTKVDGRNIEDIRPGDWVMSFDHESDTAEKRKVLSCFKRKLSGDLAVINGELVCTANHPVFSVTRGGYVDAGKLERGECILRLLRREDSAGISDEGTVGRAQTKGACLLFYGVREELLQKDFVRDGKKNEQKIRFRENGLTQSHVFGSVAPQDGKYFETHKTSACCEGREWLRHDEAAGDSLEFVGASVSRSGVRSQDAQGYSRSPVALQNRHRGSYVQTGNRDRRCQPSCACEALVGREENVCLRAVRVDSIEVFKQGGFGKWGSLCGDGYVYNFEVEKNHNYFANGYLVHNCHHAAAASYRKILDYFKPRLLLGFTATPNRGDGVGLESIFEDIIFERDLEWGIKNGYLADIKCIRCDIGFDLRSVSSRLGDYSAEELDKAVNIESANKAVADAYRRYARGRTLVFAVSVAHAEAIAREIPGSEVVIGGKDRKLTLERFQNGDLKCIVNCMVFTEGTDLPGVETVIVARPTQNVALYTQMVGRGTRLFPGKEYLTLIDCVGASALNLCTAPSLLGLDVSLLDKKDKKSLDEVDIFDIPDELARAMDKPEYWIKNARIVDLWAKGRKYNLHGVNWFRTARGDLVLGKPKFRLPAPDKLGRVVWNGAKVSYQRALDDVYKSLCTNYEDMRNLWDAGRARKWGDYRATDKQKDMVRRFLPDYDVETLTKAEAGAILTRMFLGRDLR